MFERLIFSLIHSYANRKYKYIDQYLPIFILLSQIPPVFLQISSDNRTQLETLGLLPQKKLGIFLKEVYQFDFFFNIYFIHSFLR